MRFTGITYYTEVTLSLPSGVHRVDNLFNKLFIALTPDNVFLASDTNNSSTQIVKLARYWYLGRVHDLHRSNRFASSKGSLPDDLPDSWLPPDIIQSRTEYNKRRDIWYLGVLFLQMIGGLGITSEVPDPRAALDRRMSYTSSLSLESGV